MIPGDYTVQRGEIVSSETNWNVKRFWNFVAKGLRNRELAALESCDPTTCFFWKGPYDDRDNPVFYYRDMRLSAGRLAFELFHRVHIAKHTRTERSCGKIGCVNPAHLLVPAEAQRPIHESVSPLVLYIEGHKGYTLFTGDEAPGMAKTGELTP